MLSSQQPEIGSGSDRARGHVHQAGVGNVAIGEHHNVDSMLGNELLQVGFLKDRNA